MRRMILLWVLLLVGCSGRAFSSERDAGLWRFIGDDAGVGGAATGGDDAGVGGAAMGGDDAGVGGAATGGDDAGAGGSATGGAGAGGAATGGDDAGAGGSATGGAGAGGSATGGAGGSATGGAGGSATGGAGAGNCPCPNRQACEPSQWGCNLPGAKASDWPYLGLQCVVSLVQCPADHPTFCFIC